MSLPAPNLDDRRFQDLVDDAKRLVQRNCPEWTDHNVSDPGITLIESFAFMVDQLLYRLNRVPDRNYVKFLELIGLHLYPPTAARADVTFWLSAPQSDVINVPADTEVATRRSDATDPVTFTTIGGLDIVPSELSLVLSQVQEGELRDHTLGLSTGQGFYCFDRVPKPGDLLYVGLDQACPSNAVSIHFNCEIEGVGVDPKYPPLVWEVWNGDDWVGCDQESDSTGGLNRDGDVVLHLPSTHGMSLVDNQLAAWIRCRVTTPYEGQPFYSSSPRITAVSAATVGGTSEAIHAAPIRNEVIGISEGIAHQEFVLLSAPVVRGPEPITLQVSDQDSGWQDWTRVESFANTGPDDRHFTLDETSGTIRLGPAVVDEKGDLQHYGAVPPKAAALRVPMYRSGGGAAGTVTRGALNVLKSSLAFITRVENRRPATGGVDGESIDDAKLRGPILLRTRDRAVTAEDFESLAKDAAPEVARVRCATAGDGTGADAGGVRVYVVPAAAEDELGRIRFEDMSPPDELTERIRHHLDERRILGTRISIEPPAYTPFTVVAEVRPKPKSDPTRLQTACLEALYRYFHPITGGPEGDGWPFGRPLAQGEVFSVLQRVKGVELVENVRLFLADPTQGQRSKDPLDRIELGKHVLAFSWEHIVRVRS